MKTPPPACANPIRIGWLFLLFILPAHADSWREASKFDTLSENKKFLAHVFPAEEKSPPVLIVFSIVNSRTNEMWRTKLSNPVSPTRVYISNDGAYAVTLDNWGGIGYGDDVVAIYGRQGQLAKYSLEEIAPLPKAEAGSQGSFFDRSAYRDKFTHSTSSRHWRENSVEFLDDEVSPVLFCLWLDWDNRWVAWQMNDGKLIKPTADQVRHFNLEGRKRALKAIHISNRSSAVLNFLGRMRIPEDRPLIEKWLQDTEFSTGSWQGSSSERSEMFFAFTASSYKRKTADKILSRWDALEDGEKDFGVYDDYWFLGTLKCSVTFATAPKKKEGSIRLYLIPEVIPLSRWFASRPEHYLIANLSSSFPFIFTDGQLKEGKLGNTVNFIIYGITPGKYQLKAVWDRMAPFTGPDDVLCVPRKGDYESLESPGIQIHRGAVTEGIRLECTKLVGP